MAAAKALIVPGYNPAAVTKAEVAAARAQVAAEQATQRAKDQKELAEKAKAQGMKRRRVRAPDGSVREVWCYSTSYHAMGFQDHQIAAAEQFAQDWETAFRGLRGQSFEPGVDGGSNAHRFHSATVMAQGRISQCKKYLGERTWEIVKAIVINGATITGMKGQARTHDRNLRQEVDNAFNDLDAFYSGSRRKDRTWEAFERFNMERAEMIAQAEREVG